VLVARGRATSIRYLAVEAGKRGMFESQAGATKRWTATELNEISKLRHDWILSNRMGVSPHFGDVKIGDKLPRRVIGPHSIASFTTEYRAFLVNIWGTFPWVAPLGVEDPRVYQDPGWVEGFAFDEEGAMIDPRKRDGLRLAAPVGPTRRRARLAQRRFSGSRGLTSYVSAKSGVVSLTKCLALEFAPHGDHGQHDPARLHRYAPLGS
jgi:hypothetical protein